MDGLAAGVAGDRQERPGIATRRPMAIRQRAAAPPAPPAPSRRIPVDRGRAGERADPHRLVPRRAVRVPGNHPKMPASRGGEVSEPQSPAGRCAWLPIREPTPPSPGRQLPKSTTLSILGGTPEPPQEAPSLEDAPFAPRPEHLLVARPDQRAPPAFSFKSWSSPSNRSLPSSEPIARVMVSMTIRPAFSSYCTSSHSTGTAFSIPLAA